MPPAALVLGLLVFAAAPGAEAWRASHPRPAAVASTLSLGMVTDETLAAIRSDGSTDLAELEAMLGRIREGVVAERVCAPEPGDAADALAGDGWRLWAFWGMDAPECKGLGQALIRARATGLAAIHVVHLASLRAVEEHLFRMNDYREAMLAAAKAQDQARCDALAIAWQDELGEGGVLTKAFHGGRLRLIGRVDQARALRVDSVPCFRLVSPAGRVHALDGFAPEVDLGAWLARCRAWEAAVERGERP